MNKIIIGTGVVAIIAISSLFLFNNNTLEYVATVDDEITQLENELASLGVSVTLGTLSPNDATKAKAKIVTRIDAINAATSASQKAQLTDAQRVQLIDGLNRLKQVLIKYNATLIAVDEAILTLPENQRPKLNRGNGGGSRNSLAIIATETIEIVEKQVEEITDDITDEEIMNSVIDETADDTARTNEQEETAEDQEGNDTNEVNVSETTDESNRDTTSEEVISNETDIQADINIDSETTN